MVLLEVSGYEFSDVLGEGAFGLVYRARQESVGREVAVKVIRSEYADNPEFIRRFEAEAQLVAQLEHPNIVPLYDYWRDAEGAFLVMRLLEGGSVADSLADGPWSLADTVRLVQQVGGGLAAGHRRGVVHRDVKPSNVLLDGDGNGYLSDFGIARDTKAATRQTATGAVAPLSPAYMAPEQLGDGEVSPATDIYSLGVLIFEVLAGRHPFPDDSIARLIRAHVEEPLPPVGEIVDDIPAAVDEVIGRATAKQPGARFGDVAELVAAFSQAVLGERDAELSAAPLVMVNPYKGLRAFEEGDAADFFGRGVLTGELVEALGQSVEGSSLLAVVGPSGAGKSSVVRAGLVPALRRGALPGSDGWFIAEMIPGQRPFNELETVLLRMAPDPPATLLELLTRDDHGIYDSVNRILPPDAELLLVIDQFEEVFALVDDPAVTEQFVAGLVTAATDPRSRFRVVVTLRADFYDRPLAYPGLAELMRHRTVTVVPLTVDELERAVDGPAHRVGVEVETALMAEIVTDVIGQPGALPLLQYTLTELFEQRHGTTLTLGAYRELGGIAGALGRKAQQTLDSLDPSTQEAARQVMLRLVTLGEGTEDTRRRVPRSELAAAGLVAAVDEVLAAFGTQRLLAFDYDAATHEPTVEVAHEALIREWPRLRSWLDDARDDIRTQRRLAQLAAEWENAGRDAGMLAAGTRLARMEAWDAATTVALSDIETAYLDASITQRTEQEAEEQLRVARERQLERRSRTRLRILVAAMAAASVIALALTGFALNQQNRAQDQADLARAEADRATTAEQQALDEAGRADSEAERAHTAEEIAERSARIATARSLVANSQATLDADPQLALLLALEAVSATNPDDEGTLPEATNALRAANQRNDSLTPFATLQEEGSFRFRPADGGASVPWPRAFSPDGASVVTIDNDGTIHLFDASTGAELPADFAPVDFDPSTRDFVTISFNAAGDSFAAATVIGETRVYSLDGTITSMLPEARHVAFGAVDRLIALSAGNQVLVLDGAQPDIVIATLCCHRTDVSEARITPEGDRIVAQAGAEFTIWDIATEQVIMTGPLGQVGALSTDGSRILASTAGDVLTVRDTSTTEIVWESTLDLPPGARLGAIAGNGSRIVYSDGMTIEVVDIETGAVLLAPPPYGRESETRASLNFLGSALSVDLTDTGAGLVVLFQSLGSDAASDAGNIDVWNVDDRTLVRGLRQIPVGGQMEALIDSSLTRLVSWAAGTPTQLWSISQDALSSAHDWVTTVGSSVDRLAVEQEGTVVVISGPEPVYLDIDTGLPLSDAVLPDRVVAVSPDGSLLVGAGPRGRLDVHRAADATTIWSVDAGESSTLAIDDEGTALASANGRELTIWRHGGSEPVVLAVSTPVRGIAVSSDGLWLATIDIDSFIEVRRTDDLEVVGAFFAADEANTAEVFALRPSGDTVAAGYEDGTVRVWNLETGDQTILTTHEPTSVTAIAYTPDGRLISGDADGAVVLWATDWTPASTFNISGSVTAVRLVPDANLLLIGSSDGTVRAATTSLDDLLEFGHSLATRNLTPLECTTYGIDC